MRSWLRASAWRGHGEEPRHKIWVEMPLQRNWCPWCKVHTIPSPGEEGTTMPRRQGGGLGTLWVGVSASDIACFLLLILFLFKSMAWVMFCTMKGLELTSLCLPRRMERGGRFPRQVRQGKSRQKRKLTIPIFPKKNWKPWEEILIWFKRFLPLMSARTAVHRVSFSVVSEGWRFQNRCIENLYACTIWQDQAKEHVHLHIWGNRNHRILTQTVSRGSRNGLETVILKLTSITSLQGLVMSAWTASQGTNLYQSALWQEDTLRRSDKYLWRQHFLVVGWAGHISSTSPASPFKEIFGEWHGGDL